MPQGNPLGVLSGLVFVALFLIMIASCGSVAKIFQAQTPSSYELAGSTLRAR